MDNFKKVSVVLLVAAMFALFQHQRKGQLRKGQQATREELGFGENASSADFDFAAGTEFRTESVPDGPILISIPVPASASPSKAPTSRPTSIPTSKPSTADTVGTTFAGDVSGTSTTDTDGDSIGVNNATTGTPTNAPTQVTALPLSTSPSMLPTKVPTNIPIITGAGSTGQPTKQEVGGIIIIDATESPTRRPTSFPTSQVGNPPSKKPTSSPTQSPTENGILVPVPDPANPGTPTKGPTEVPTISSTTLSTPLPTENLPLTSSGNPTAKPTGAPTASPTETSSASPTLPIQDRTGETVGLLTVRPTFNPTVAPTPLPTNTPTISPTKTPTKAPTRNPTPFPTYQPTKGPTKMPTKAPSGSPTKQPTQAPTTTPTKSPTRQPTLEPTMKPTDAPTESPTASPTKEPTKSPTLSPTKGPTKSPTSNPTLSPTKTPTVAPTTMPSAQPTRSPTKTPTPAPTTSPTGGPTPIPSQETTELPTSPTKRPTSSPSLRPTKSPTRTPTQPPTKSPTAGPTTQPTANPTLRPTATPTSATPTSTPTISPTANPTSPPTMSQNPSSEPSSQPSSMPTSSQNPSSVPSLEPTGDPTSSPTVLEITQGLQASCSNIDTTRFNICLDLQLSSDDRLDAFAKARQLWESAIVGHEDVYVGFGDVLKDFSPQGGSWATDVPLNVDDLYIAGFEVPIDGPGKILGSAAPQFVNRLTGLPINGVMEFDSEDVDEILQTNPTFWENVIVHEMGHVLGIGTIWEDLGLVSRSTINGVTSYSYLGEKAQAEWEALGCTTPLPIETDGGSGTAGGHWDEFCLVNELMTGFLGTGNVNTLSAITIGSLDDMGYTVSYDAASAFTSRNVRRSCCQPNDRKLYYDERNLAPKKDTKPPISAELWEMAATRATEKLRWARDHAPTDIPDDVEYVADKNIKIFMMGDNGQIEDATFTWEDIKHRL